MNVRRGLLRLWLVLSALFVGLVVFAMSGNIADRFERAAETRTQGEKEYASVGFPLRCDKARGVEGTDFHRGKALPQTCWYSIWRFRALFPEFSSADDSLLSRKLWEVGFPGPEGTDIAVALDDLVAIELADARLYALGVAAVALGVPLGMLAIGAAFFWAVAGFNRDQQP